MTKAKAVKGIKNGTKDKSNVGGAPNGTGDSVGANGKPVEPAGSIAGPAASEPVANGNAGIANGPGGGEQQTRNPGDDAPAEPKRTGPGRHPGACTCAKCAERRASATSPKATTKGVVLNNAKWAKSIYGFHQMLGAFLPIPDIQVSLDATGAPVIGPKMVNGAPVMLVHISMDEATAMADAAYGVAVEYDLAKYFGGKSPALLTAALTVVMIYGPKVKTVMAIGAWQKAQRQGPQSAADMVNPVPANTDAVNGSNPGAYKYG